jgi:hypothetical protein
VNLPTALFLIAPFAMLPFGPAHLLWMTLMALSLLLAAILMWSVGANHAPGVSLLLSCILLANSEVLFAIGNAAGIVVSLCVVASWCFLRERFVPVGVLCLAIGLAIKPQDAGPVWLFFLLAGGVPRKRALQAFVVTVLLSLPSVLWVMRASPDWMQEMRTNLAATTGHGDINDPGPASLANGTAQPIIDMQSVIAVFRDDPRIYNLVTYLICGPLILVWALVALRSRPSPANAWLALAAIVSLSMLVTYHRLYDAKLLILTVPVCAMLWAEGGPIGWLAIVLNTAGIVLTGDISLLFLRHLAASVQMPGGGLVGEMLTAVSIRPVPVALLVMGIFYLWVYVRRAYAPVAERGSQ